MSLTLHEIFLKNDISAIPMQQKNVEATKKLSVKDMKSLIKLAMEPFNHL